MFTKHADWKIDLLGIEDVAENDYPQSTQYLQS